MESGLMVIVAVFLVAVVAGVVVLAYLAGKKRISDMTAVATRLGYAYAERGDALADALHGFDLFFQHGLRPGQVRNVLSGQAEGAAAVCFDYEYTVGTHDNRHTVRQSILLLESQALDLPAFVMRPEGLGQKLAQALGRQDINFEENVEFSKAYQLLGTDEARIRALFGGQALSFFAARRGLSVEGCGPKLLYYRAGKRVAPEAISSFIAEGRAALRGLAGV